MPDQACPKCGSLGVSLTCSPCNGDRLNRGPLGGAYFALVDERGPIGLDHKSGCRPVHPIHPSSIELWTKPEDARKYVRAIGKPMKLCLISFRVEEFEELRADGTTWLDHRKEKKR